MIKIKFKLSPAILQAQISNSTKALYITNGQNIFFPCKIGTFFKQAGDKKNPYNIVLGYCMLYLSILRTLKTVRNVWQ